MSSPAEPPDAGTDLGLLAPVVAGTVCERLTGDEAVAAALVHTEAGLIRALVDAGIAPESVRPAADQVAAAHVDARRLALEAVAGASPVIPLVQTLRSAVPAEYADWVHYGATSQDILDTALMLVAADAFGQTWSDLTRLAASLADLVEEYRHQPCVARTLTQQALPTTLGMRLAGWLAGVHDALRIVRACAASLPVSLAGAVGTASAYGEKAPAVAERLAATLGLQAPAISWHTRRTPVLDLAHAAGITGAACGKIAADVLVLAQTEVGEAAEATGGGSSAMAHKANPAQSILITTAARQLPALTASLGTAAALTEQERPAGAWQAEWQPLRTTLRLAGAAAERTAVLVAGLRFDHDAMRRNLDQLATNLDAGPDWVAAHTASTDAWIDRVLDQHATVLS